MLNPICQGVSVKEVIGKRKKNRPISYFKNNNKKNALPASTHEGQDTKNSLSEPHGLCLGCVTSNLLRSLFVKIPDLVNKPTAARWHYRLQYLSSFCTSESTKKTFFCANCWMLSLDQPISSLNVVHYTLIKHKCGG